MKNEEVDEALEKGKKYDPFSVKKHKKRKIALILL